MQGIELNRLETFRTLVSRAIGRAGGSSEHEAHAIASTINLDPETIPPAIGKAAAEWVLAHCGLRHLEPGPAALPKLAAPKPMPAPKPTIVRITLKTAKLELEVVAAREDEQLPFKEIARRYGWTREEARRVYAKAKNRPRREAAQKGAAISTCPATPPALPFAATLKD